MAKYSWKVILKALEGKTVKEVSEEFLIPISTIYAFLNKNKNGINSSKREKYNKVIGKVTDQEASRLLGISINAVKAFRRRHSIPIVYQNKKERLVQNKLVAALKTYKEFVRLRFGIADVVTDTHIYEIKYKLNKSTLERALGQLFLYKLDLPRHKLCIVAEKVEIGKELIDLLLEEGVEIKIIKNK